MFVKPRLNDLWLAVCVCVQCVTYVGVLSTAIAKSRASICVWPCCNEWSPSSMRCFNQGFMSTGIYKALITVIVYNQF